MQMDFKTVEKKEQNCNEEIQIKCINIVAQLSRQKSEIFIMN